MLLTLVFTRCAGICSPFLMSLKSAVDAIGGVGTNYRVVVLSFDPQDTSPDMAALARHIGVSGNAGWIFGTSTATEIERVSQSTGFWFQWDADRSQFDHPAMLVGVRAGRIARLLVGGVVLPVRLKEVVDELRGEFVPAYLHALAEPFLDAFSMILPSAASSQTGASCSSSCLAARHSLERFLDFPLSSKDLEEPPTLSPFNK